MGVEPRRALGANVKLRAKLASAAAGYGSQPGGNWTEIRAISNGLAKNQALERTPLLGGGRDPERPERGPIDVAGQIVVPIDKRMFAWWLYLGLGAPTTTGPLGARGWIGFASNPADTDTITLDGVAWTFVAGAPVGNQTQIGADLAATLDQLVIDLNGSVDANIAAATYSRSGHRLEIDHDTADATGNSYTLATDIASAVLSNVTLYGGGLYKHLFVSDKRQGGVPILLPDMAIETEHADIAGETDGFVVRAGAMLNSMQISRQRSGTAQATLEMIAQSEQTFPATQAGTPNALALDRFFNFKGNFYVDEVEVANLSTAELTVGNNLTVFEGLRRDGLIAGLDPGETQIGLNLTARFSNNTVKQRVEAEEAIAVRLGFVDRVDGMELEFLLHQVDLPSGSAPVEGPGPVEVTYSDGQGSRETGVDRALTVSLWNDVTDYPATP
ncbi:MAG: phage tail tube protein [Kiloniellales bacterium]|nr:phage tail tube protein [Kiloniellales bacterium]